MTDPLAALLAAGAVPTTSLPATSRYADVGTSTYTPATSPGEEPVPIAFLRRRLVPPPERFATVSEHACTEGDRRDLLAARYLGDPQLWWRIADANGILDPAGMTEPPGRRLRITLGPDLPGASHA
ncbi:hypothetical protein [Kribbia dieselivorans]|uniref:hypothetical protein n=1 Tax=Kribbia dieselivorans TaxID=331526 RepID=UPI0008389F25|nr:hypothetical protein [Kribbia dieselivorans]